MKLEIFFDYACPYCYSGLECLRKLLPDYPGIEAVWIPCEAHPRPERYGIHSDVAIQGFYFARENGCGAWDYNDRIFKAIFEERLNIESPGIVAGCLNDLGLDSGAFLSDIKTGGYAGMPDKNNRLAWGENQFYAVPSYKMEGRRLLSRDGIAVTKTQLEAFLRGDDSQPA